MSVGGIHHKDFLDAVSILDTRTGTWNRGPALGVKAVFGQGVVAVDGRVYVIGGHDGKGALDSVFMLDVQRGAEEWVSKQPKPTASGAFATAVLEGKVYCLGGHLGHQGPGEIREVEVYDPKAGAWERFYPGLDSERMSWAAAVLGSTTYAFGGGGYSSGPLVEVLRWAPGDSDWRYAENLPEARRDHSVIRLGDSLYIVGGTGPNGPTSVCWQFRP